MTVALTVYGTPAPKGSRTLGTRRDGSHYTRPAASGEHAWVQAVARQAQWTASQLEPPRPPYRVELCFYLARPKTPAHEHPSKVDVDKLARAVLDGLVQGRLLTDDRHVVELAARKGWAGTPAGECVRVEIATAAAQQAA